MIRPTQKNGCWILVLVLLASFQLGCGRTDLPELGKVTGVVTLDGELLTNATVTFRRNDGGRPASGVTNDQGEYRLLYIENPSPIYGCQTGQQSVIISTLLDTDEPGGLQPERVPQKYRGRDTQLQVTVEPSSATHDFDLVSGK
ncbi:MAG: carboxypeptidase-like regulatory domain-containing protein [Pirellulales bacterium]|jgi:hypothetical protein